jgi:UDP-glucose 4-epimerase
MKKTNKKILITGGAGYIGQNLVSFFLKENYQIYVIDNLSTSISLNGSIKKKVNFYKIDLTNENKVKFFFKNKNFDLIIHLAAFSGVQEFNKNVLKSFNNNVLSTKNLVRFGFQNQNTKLIFASSAAVYGKVSSSKISEINHCRPANYYGLSKLACENIINQEFQNKEIKYAILRYFNVVGSIVDFKIKKKINSLFDIISNNVKKKRYKININGKKLNTKDGTPERDFIHISDLCKIHKKVYLYLKKNKRAVLNCGSGTRYSVLKIIKSFERKINKKFKISYKITNPDETQTICSNINALKNLLQIDIEKKKLNDLIKDYE